MEHAAQGVLCTHTHNTSTYTSHHPTWKPLWSMLLRMCSAHIHITHQLTHPACIHITHQLKRNTHQNTTKKPLWSMPLRMCSAHIHITQQLTNHTTPQGNRCGVCCSGCVLYTYTHHLTHKHKSHHHKENRCGACCSGCVLYTYTRHITSHITYILPPKANH